MAFYGINCRATSTFVTDGANDDYSLGSTTPRTGPGGHQHSWGSDKTGSARDRNSSIGDSRLAGVIQHANGGSPTTFTVSLPDGAGIYNIRLALGDASFSHTDMKFVLKDGGTTLLTVSGNTSGAGRWFDATGVERSDATWPGSNATAEVVFSGSTATIELGNTAGSDNSCLAHVAFEFVSGAAAALDDGGSFPGFEAQSNPTVISVW